MDAALTAVRTFSGTHPRLLWRRPSHDLVRPWCCRPRKRWIARVCSGLARRFGVSATFVRLAFVITCLLPGPQFVIYIALWILMPNDN